MVDRTDGPVRYQVEQRLRGVPAGTELSVHLAIELRGAMRLAAGLMAPTIRREAEADLERLARLFIEQADGDPGNH